MLSHLPFSNPENNPGSVISQRLAGPLSPRIFSTSQAAEPRESWVRISLAEYTGTEFSLAITCSFEGIEVWQGRRAALSFGGCRAGYGCHPQAAGDITEGQQMCLAGAQGHGDLRAVHMEFADVSHSPGATATFRRGKWCRWSRRSR